MFVPDRRGTAKLSVFCNPFALLNAKILTESDYLFYKRLKRISKDGFIISSSIRGVGISLFPPFPPSNIKRSTATVLYTTKYILTRRASERSIFQYICNNQFIVWNSILTVEPWSTLYTAKRLKKKLSPLKYIR